MSKRSKYSRPSPETDAVALAIARGTQRPGQTKEQTRLIAQGIKKGIDQYKRQQKARSRELDRRLKGTGNHAEAASADEARPESRIVYRHARLPWILLGVSWLLFAFFVYLAASGVDLPFAGG